MASYNGEEYILEQVTSILKSLEHANESDYEIIVSDDNSSDQTREIIKKINHAQIFLHKGPGLGLIKNFESLLKRSSGEIIFLADQDDIWVADKVSKCLRALEASDLIVSDAKVVDKDLNILHPSFFALRKSGPGFFKNLIKNSYLGCCMAFKRDVMLDIGCMPFPDSLPMHDWWLGLMFQKSAKVLFLNEQLVLYRRHGKNASASSEKSRYSLLTKLNWRLNLLRNLF